MDVDKPTDKKEEKKNEKEDSKKPDPSVEQSSAIVKNAVPYNQVIVHPLVLLSVVDHYNRVAKDTQKRVVGVLLGEVHKGKVDITNSYAVPFEEDPKDSAVWFLDFNYHERMFRMFKKVSARERVVGWYSTGPKIKPADMEINELFRRSTPNPVLVIIDVNPKDDLEIPTDAYVCIQTDAETRAEAKPTFIHLPSEVGAYEAEEVGVEHLLRDIRDTTESSLSDQINGKLNALRSLEKRLKEMVVYLDDVAQGKMAVNHQIIYNIQDMFNLAPNLKVEQLVKAFAVNTNDNSMAIYIGSLIRSVIALHNLINNKLMNIEAEKKANQPPKTEEELKKEKEEKEKAEKEKLEKQKADEEAAAGNNIRKKKDTVDRDKPGKK